MTHLRNGGMEPQFNGGMLDESQCQLAGIRLNGDQRQSKARTGSHSPHLNEHTHHLTNGSASEGDLQYINDAISNLSLRPTTAQSATSSSPSVTSLPSVAPRPSKSRTQQLNHRVRSKSSAQMGYQFHVGENNNSIASRLNGPAGNNGEENRTLRFVGKRGLSVGGDDITSAKGTVRGVTNRVKAGIMNFTYKPLSHKKKTVNNDDERDKIIIYTTSMRIVRQTFEDCQFVRKLFQNHRVRYEERDLFMNAEHQQELHDRLEGEVQQVTLPIVFIDGELVGDVEKLEELNETGQLRKILERFEKNAPTSDCSECGGFRYMPCQVCRGSKKSLHRNNFIDQFLALRCSHCDDNGLQKCTLCNK